MTKILAVATSSDAKLKGSKTGLWLSELTHFLRVIKARGWDYDIASPKGGRVPLDEKSVRKGKRGMDDPANQEFSNDPIFQMKLASSLECSEVNPAHYDAIYLAGGHGTMFDFRQSEHLQHLITELYSDGKYLSGVCHGVSGFVDAKDKEGNLIIRDRVVTGFSNFEDRLAGVFKEMPFLLETELKRNGAKYVKNLLPFTRRVEADGRLITGQNPQSAAAVGEKLVQMIGVGRTGASRSDGAHVARSEAVDRAPH